MCIYVCPCIMYVHLCMYVTHLMNKQMCFFDKNVLVEPQFYIYPTTVL